MGPNVDYARVAEAYDARYSQAWLGCIEPAILEFAGAHGTRVLEVGCGTGHWLALLRQQGAVAAGLDASAEMLAVAAAKVPSSDLRQGWSTRLPWTDGSFDRVLFVNAVHHLDDRPASVAEAARVLAPGGGVLVVGLDPSRRGDRWFVYDYFDGCLETDLRRYPTTGQLEAWMVDAGLAGVRTEVAGRLTVHVPARAALQGGLLAKTTVSQLTLLDDAAYRRGLERIEHAAAEADVRGEELLLSIDGSLYGTSGWRPTPRSS
jgi:SAM-dependent methyltransferase